MIARKDLQRPYSESATSRELLPFRVRVANQASDLRGIADVRSIAYGRHIPEVGERLKEPEPDDLRDDVIIVLAESKLDGSVLGSMRLQPNFHRPLRIEGETLLPQRFTGKRLIEFMRLTILPGSPGRMVMAALSKAAYEICWHADIDYILVAGRRPVSLMYTTMQFTDVLDGRTVPLSYAAGVPHSIYCLPVAEADRLWRTVRQPLYPFMAHVVHPDIEIDYESGRLRRFLGRSW